MRLMTDGPDEVTLERARRQALTKAFEEADTDKSGTLDAGEIMELLKNSDPLRTHSELNRQVGRTGGRGRRRGRKQKGKGSHGPSSVWFIAAQISRMCTGNA